MSIDFIQRIKEGDIVTCMTKDQALNIGELDKDGDIFLGDGKGYFYALNFDLGGSSFIIENHHSDNSVICRLLNSNVGTNETFMLPTSILLQNAKSMSDMVTDAVISKYKDFFEKRFISIRTETLTDLEVSTLISHCLENEYELLSLTDKYFTMQKNNNTMSEV